MNQTSDDSSSPNRSPGTRGAKSCIWAGIAYFVPCFFAGGAVGWLCHCLVRSMLGHELESGYYLWYEGRVMLVEMILASSLLGAWMGWRSFKPAAVAASGQIPQPPFFTRMVARTRRGALAMLSMYVVPRWEVLTEPTKKPWRLMPKIMAGILVVTSLGLAHFLGRDSDFRLAIWVGGGIAVIIADALLVNRIAGWRDAKELKSVKSKR